MVKMFTKAFMNIFLVFLLTCNVVPAVYAEACIGPEGQAGECVPFLDCPELSNIMNMSLPITSEKDRDRIKKANCGFEGFSPKVCCPSATLSDSMDIEDPSASSELSSIQPPPPPDVTNHPNINLLPADCGAVNDDKILSSKAQLFQYPWVARLYYKAGDINRFLCTGSIISSKYVLTAAQCIKESGRFKLSGVRLGEYNINTEEDCQQFGDLRMCSPPVQDIEVEESIPHPGFGSSKQDDIALVRLKTEIDFFKENTYPVCLPISKENANLDLDNTRLISVNWGDVPRNSSDGVLDAIIISVRNNQNCSDIYGRTLPSGISYKQFCGFRISQAPENRLGGDGGGPVQTVTMTNSSVRYVQYGIISFGPTRPSMTKPDIFTKIPYYMDWILDQMKP